MQYWIFFEDGAGGDSFANLLEHSNNIETLDQERSWRIHRYVDYRAKFWMPCPDQNHCFTNLDPMSKQRGYAFLEASNVLLPRYLELVTDNKNIVVTSRDIQLNFLLGSDQLDILTHNQIKILLKIRDNSNTSYYALNKNLQNFRVRQVKNNVNIETDESKFDFVIYFEDLLDWTLASDLFKQMGLVIDNNDFFHWKDIVEQKIIYCTPGIEFYQSYLVNDIYHYKIIDQPSFQKAKFVTHFDL
jgi:hypothetical protein